VRVPQRFPNVPAAVGEVVVQTGFMDRPCSCCGFCARPVRGFWSRVATGNPAGGCAYAERTAFARGISAPDWTSTGPCWRWRATADRPRAAETVRTAKTSQVSQPAAAPCRPGAAGRSDPRSQPHPMIEESSQTTHNLSATLEYECAESTLEYECAESQTVFHALTVKTRISAFSRQSDYGDDIRFAQSSLAVRSPHPVMNSSSFPVTITVDCMTHLRSRRL